MTDDTASETDSKYGSPFPRPPVSFVDSAGRELTIRPLEFTDDAGFEALVSMYDDFDPSMRAQGIPPVGEHRVREWLEALIDDEGYNVVAWDDDAERAVGHATLVSDGEAGYELAIFVHQDYQGSGVGTRLIRSLLGYGVFRGVEDVWLTVERWNHAAVALYEKVGFAVTNEESFELEMEIDLSAAQTESTG